MNNGRILVIGIGNPYRHDDGLGPAVVSLLRDRDLPGVELAESDGELGSLIELWAGAELAVVVDAVRTRPRRPGRVHRISAHHPAMAGAPAAAASSHGVELSEAVRLARVLDRMPQRLLLFAVEAGDTSFGLGLSPAIADAAVVVTDEIAELVRVEVAR
jgi:hydrogenase maturation protease